MLKLYKATRQVLLMRQLDQTQATYQAKQWLKCPMVGLAASLL